MMLETFSFSKLAPLAFLVLSNGSAEAGKYQEGRGFRVAEENCTRCHSAGLVGDSPVKAAPSFRTLGRLYSMKDLADKLKNGTLGEHPVMPHWLIDPADVDDLVLYIGTIQSGP